MRRRCHLVVFRFHHLLAKFPSAFPVENFEVVFISGDKDEKTFVEHFDEMPWLALPFTKDEKTKCLALVRCAALWGRAKVLDIKLISLADSWFRTRCETRFPSS